MPEEHWQQAKRVFDDALRQEPRNAQDSLVKFAATIKLCAARSNHSCHRSTVPAAFWKRQPSPNLQTVIQARTLEAGKCFGRYEIINQLGVGGMGEVLPGQRQRTRSKVAIKILNEEFSQDESNLQRFVSEAKAASALNHPNILTIYEFGEAEDARFIVSEYIEGKTLRAIIRESRLRQPRFSTFPSKSRAHWQPRTKRIWFIATSNRKT
jgi:hypothetical protein